jgi:hypothetical protein
MSLADAQHRVRLRLPADRDSSAARDSQAGGRYLAMYRRSVAQQCQGADLLQDAAAHWHELQRLVVRCLAEK